MLLFTDFSGVPATNNDVPADLSICQLCNTALHDPQMFPCFHAFCLPCLGGMNPAAGTRVCCPLCGTAVIVTSSGLGAPPCCLFLCKLMKLKQTFGNESPRICDICSAGDSIKTAATLPSMTSTSTRCDVAYDY